MTSSNRSLPRLSEILACPGPAPKRLAPKRRDLGLDTRPTPRKEGTTPMPKYNPALDAAPQDGRWLDDPAAVTTVLQFLISKLSSTDLAELDAHLTEGTTPQATDGRLPDGDLKAKLLLYSPRSRRSIVDSLCDARPGTKAPSGRTLGMDEVKLKSYGEMFPNANRLKKGL